MLVIASFALIDLAIQYVNNGYSVAIVNGVRVPRSVFLTRLEKVYGVTTVDRLIEEKLIVQGAKDLGITVTEEQVQTDLNDYYNQSGGRDSVLAALKTNNLTEEDLIEQIRIGLYLEGALKKDISYTDQDLKKFFDEYKSYIFDEENPSFDDNKAKIEDLYINQKVQEGKDAWVAKLSEAGKVQNNVTTKPTYGFLKTTINIVTNLYNQIKSSAEGK